MRYKQCTYCKSSVDSKEFKCPSCAAPLPQATYAQKNIVSDIFNTVLPPISNPFTNTDSNNNYNRTSTKPLLNKWITLLLLIFAGGFGAHKFYENKIGLGIAYIFTFGFFGIGFIIDFFKILSLPLNYQT